MVDGSQISLRALNRTLLDRQFLLERVSRSTLGVVARLVALQAQEPNWPYIGLWARVVDFRPDDLMSLLSSGQVVRGAGLRSTQHLVAGEDFRWLRPTIQPVLDRNARSPYVTRETIGLDLDEITAVGIELLGDDTLSRRELRKRFVEKWPGRNGQVMVAALERRVPLVHSPATGAWGRWGSPAGVAVVRAEFVVGEMSESQPEALIRRYLAAFGPAAVSDFQSWSGLTRMGEVFEIMRPGLGVYRTEVGELFDLPDAALADVDVPAPVRFLPAFDNVLLGHATRTRIVSDDDRKVVMPGGAQVVPTFLVDGFVGGTWSLQGSELLVKNFRPLSRAIRSEVVSEAEQLLEFVIPGDPARKISFAPV